jgi:uncharacterized membrane protein YhaH (DUF805 family)
MHPRPLGATVREFRDRSGTGLLPIDPLLLAAAVGLVACSLVTLATATQDDSPGNPDYFVNRQAVYAGIGLVLMLAISRLDYARLRDWRVGIYAFLIASILVVLALGSATRGSQRAIELPFFSLQTSELGKVLLVVVLAAVVVERMRDLGRRETTALVMLVALVPALLVIAQPDLGSGLVYVSIALVTLFVAGTRWTHFAALGALATAAVVVVLVAAPAVGVEVLEPYQMDRLTAFVNPDDDPRAQGYQQQQSLVAVGAGGKTGRDPDQARLPARAPHRLRLRGGRRGVRLHGRRTSVVVVRPADLAHAADPDDVQGSARDPDRGRRTCNAYASDLHQRGNDNWDHAHHRRHAAPHELWRLVGDRHLHRSRASAERLRACARDSAREGPGPSNMRGKLEKESTCHGRPWRDQSRHPRAGGQALR